MQAVLIGIYELWQVRQLNTRVLYLPTTRFLLRGFQREDISCLVATHWFWIFWTQVFFKQVQHNTKVLEISGHFLGKRCCTSWIRQTFLRFSDFYQQILPVDCWHHSRQYLYTSLRANVLQDLDIGTCYLEMGPVSPRTFYSRFVTGVKFAL